jgi:integron integrase
MNISNAIHLVREACTLRHFSFKTEKTYVYWLGRYGVFLKDHRVTAWTKEQKMEAFLGRLAREGISASTQNQAFNAVLFFYRQILKQEVGRVSSLRAKQPGNPRHCPTQEDVGRLLAAVSDIYGYPTRLIVHLLYACGLRVTEPLNLRIKDVNLKESKLYVYQAKGGKGRVVLLPACLTGALEQQMTVAKRVAEQDRARGIPVPLPGLLAKKYPSAARSERWAWFFPSHTVCRDPRSGNVVRWRCHESNVQRAVRAAALTCGLDGLTPHYLRHAYATHALNRGAHVRDLQVVLGHSYLETTMRYLHTEAGRVASPLASYAASPAPTTGKEKMDSAGASQ